MYTIDIKLFVYIKEVIGHVIPTMMEASRKDMLYYAFLLSNYANLIHLSPHCISAAIEFISKYILLDH